MLGSELRKFVCPEIVFGHHSRALAGQYAANLGGRRVLVVTDPGVREAGWTQDVVESLEEFELETVLFDAITPNPKDREVQEGAELYRREGCNLIVAVGGGSPMDCAKGIGILSTNGGHIRDYEGADQIENPCPPLVFLPTTAGTSADVSQFAIITNTDTQAKMAIVSKAIVPDVAVIDPVTTTTMSADLTAHTGMDAFTHATEALASNAASPLTDLHALEAVRLVTRHLHDARENLDDLEQRSAMMMASMLAGLAFSNAGLGAVHAMAHSLGGLHDLPHGECNALLLPHVVRFNARSCAAQYLRLGQSMGLEDELRDHTVEEQTEIIAKTIFDLLSTLGINHGLAELGVKRDDLSNLAALALADVCIATNPVIPSNEELVRLYEQAL